MMAECSIKVCYDCAETIANGPGEGTPYEDIEEQWPVAENWMFTLDDSEEAHDDFSTLPCGACGSRLAGGRMKAVAWQYRMKEA